MSTMMMTTTMMMKLSVMLCLIAYLAPLCLAYRLSPTSIVHNVRRYTNSKAMSVVVRSSSLASSSSSSSFLPAGQSASQRFSPGSSGVLGTGATATSLLLNQRSRPRRNRQSETMRSLVRENQVSVHDFIYPMFVHDSAQTVGISSMPGCMRHSLASMLKEVEECVNVGVTRFVLFPKVEDALKSNYGEEAYNPNGLVPRAVQMIKSKFPDVMVITDVALDPYSNQGHDGVVLDGKIVNDLTVEQLQKQAVMHASAGADMVSPSDMMDGRVGAIRDALDQSGFSGVSLMSYTAKYASAFYGPFRDALDSHPGFGDKKTYQMDPANGREALIEAALDAAEGADVIMVKPGMPYLDIIRRLRDSSSLPVAAYQVSGEYAMIKAAAERGWINERAAVEESLLAFKRAGADIVLTYYAKKAAQWLAEK